MTSLFSSDDGRTAPLPAVGKRWTRPAYDGASSSAGISGANSAPQQGQGIGGFISPASPSCRLLYTALGVEPLPRADYFCSYVFSPAPKWQAMNEAERMIALQELRTHYEMLRAAPVEEARRTEMLQRETRLGGVAVRAVDQLTSFASGAAPNGSGTTVMLEGREAESGREGGSFASFGRWLVTAPLFYVERAGWLSLCELADPRDALNAEFFEDNLPVS
jgi:hypothetical protein